MVKITNGKAPKASNQNELGQLTVAGTVPTINNLRALAKAFAPVVELRTAKDLKVSLRRSRPSRRAISASTAGSGVNAMPGFTRAVSV